MDPYKHILILVYNGADRVKVGQTFDELFQMKKDPSIQLSQDTVCQSKLLLAAAEAEILEQTVSCESCIDVTFFI
jgi:hypothetical protein